MTKYSFSAATLFATTALVAAPFSHASEEVIAYRAQLETVTKLSDALLKDEPSDEQMKLLVRLQHDLGKSKNHEINSPHWPDTVKRIQMLLAGKTYTAELYKSLLELQDLAQTVALANQAILTNELQATLDLAAEKLAKIESSEQMAALAPLSERYKNTAIATEACSLHSANALKQIFDKWQQVLILAQSDDLDAAERSARDLQHEIIRSFSNLNTLKLKDAAGKLSELIANKKQQLNQDKLDQLKPILAELSSTLLASKNPSELDETILQLSHLLKTSEQSNNRELAANIRQAHSFAIQWQDYLITLNRGDSNQTERAKSRLVESTNRNGFIARTTVINLPTEKSITAEDLAEANKNSVPAQIEQLIAKAEKLDDIAQIADQVEIITKNNPSVSYRDVGGLSQLRSTRKAYNYYLANDLAKASASLSDYSYNNSKFVPTNLIELTEHLRSLVIRKSLPDDPQFNLLDKEKPHEYTLRISALLADSEQWGAILKVIQIADACNSRSTHKSNFNNDKLAIETYLTALNYIKAKEYGFAWENLRRSISYSREIGPADEAADLMIEIKAQHIDELTKQLEAPLQQKVDPNERYRRSSSRMPIRSHEELEELVERKIAERETIKKESEKDIKASKQE